jgi:hypothetical protein
VKIDGGWRKEKTKVYEKKITRNPGENWAYPSNNYRYDYYDYNYPRRGYRVRYHRPVVYRVDKRYVRNYRSYKNYDPKFMGVTTNKDKVVIVL